MNDLSLTFGNLNTETAAQMLEFYKSISGTAKPNGVLDWHDANHEDPNVPEQPELGELTDAAGVVWHPEHHSSAQTKTKNGKWVRKKGGNKEAATAYEAQFSDHSLPAPTMPGLPGLTIPTAPDVDYDTQLLPLWQQMATANTLPMDAIDQILANHGVHGDYVQIQTNAEIRSQIYTLLTQ